MSKLDDLIEALLKNASELVAESVLLGKNGHFARAHALAHIAREELAKSMMLEAAAVRVLAGGKVDWARLMKRFRNHEDKLKLEGVQTAILLSAFGQIDQAKATLMHSVDVAKYRNQRKNTAFYVELSEGVLSEPTKQFSEEQAVRTCKLAQMWLQEQQARRSVLGRYDRRDPKVFEGMRVPDPADITSGDPSELVKALGEVQAKIWAYQNAAGNDGKS